MGKVIQIHCKSCGFHQELFTGGSLRDCETEHILSALSQTRRKLLEMAIKQGADHFSITRKPCTCGTCGTFYVLPIVKFHLNGVRTMNGVCPKCGKDSGHQWSENESIPCPACGKELQSQIIGHWD